MDTVKVYEYGENAISFMASDGGVYVSATQMSLPFGNGKRPQFWLNSLAANEFLQELAKARNLALTDLVHVTKGGNNPGTWLHEDVAMEFARWLSPAFAIWCNDRIKELLRHGITATPEKLLELLSQPESVVTMLTVIQDEREKRIAAERESAVLRPKAALMDKVLFSDEQIDVGQAAKILGLPYGRNTLFKKLREMGVFFKYRNEPKQEYVNRGYFKLREQWVEPNNHDGFVAIKVMVTQSGLSFLDELLTNNTAGHDSN